MVEAGKNFCPECGAPTSPGARFCISCGAPLEAPSPGAVPAPFQAPPPIQAPPTRAGKAAAAVFVGILVAGLAIGGWLYHRRQASQPLAAAAASGSAQAGGQSPSGNLPPGHPPLQLPAQARQFIAKVEADARKAPNNLDAWNRLGLVATRAAMFDHSYSKLAEEAYAHVLKLAPDNSDALRGIGNLDYDSRKFDEAIAAYEHYLKAKPNDAEVQTDLGTMYLYTGNPDQAIVRYKKAISIQPNFFEGYYNLGVAYGAQNDIDSSKAAFERALALAPDNDARSQVVQMLAKLDVHLPGGEPAAGAGSEGSQPGPPAVKSNSFEGAVEAMVRNLPVAGTKVAEVKWPAKDSALVLMTNFPMESMPPFAKQKFIEDLDAGIDAAKKNWHVDAPLKLQIADAASGRVMETITR